MTDETQWDDKFPRAEKQGRRARGTKYAALVADLRKNPGRWARLPYQGAYPVQVASQIRRGDSTEKAYRDFTPREEFQVEVVDGEYIRARFVGQGFIGNLSDKDLFVEFMELDDEQAHGERDPESVQAQIEPLIREIEHRFGPLAIERLAEYATSHHASGEDLIRAAKEDHESLVRIAKGKEGA